MDFDKIAATQEFEGNTVDVIFGKKRGARKRKTTSNAPEIALKFPDSESPPSQKVDSQEQPFVFTNDNIFRTRETTSALFAKYFPTEILRFTDEELAEINELHASLQRQQVAGEQRQLTQANVNELDKSCLIERFLKENEANRKQAQASPQSSSFLMDLDSPPAGL